MASLLAGLGQLSQLAKLWFPLRLEYADFSFCFVLILGLFFVSVSVNKYASLHALNR